MQHLQGRAAGECNGLAYLWCTCCMSHVPRLVTPCSSMVRAIGYGMFSDTVHFAGLERDASCVTDGWNPALQCQITHSLPHTQDQQALATGSKGHCQITTDARSVSSGWSHMLGLTPSGSVLVRSIDR